MKRFVKYFVHDPEAIRFALDFARDHGYRVAAYGWEPSINPTGRFVIHFITR
jgi:hypothetical protein